MKVVVTGASGFIGNHVINYLISQNINLFVTSTNTEKASQANWFSHVNYHAFTIGNEMDETIIRFFQGADILIHLAWQGLSDFKSEMHISVYLENQKKFIKQLSVLNIKRLINVGTCLEYGLQEGELNEEMETFPVVNYAIAKNLLRLYTEEFKNNFIEGICWIRLFYMYGSGQNENSIIPQLEKAIVEKRCVFDMSDGEQERDYLPVEKVSEFIAKIAMCKKAKGIFNCSSGEPVKIISLVRAYILQRNAQIELNLGFYCYPDYEPFRFWGNNLKLKKILDNGL